MAVLLKTKPNRIRRGRVSAPLGLNRMVRSAHNLIALRAQKDVLSGLVLRKKEYGAVNLRDRILSHASMLDKRTGNDLKRKSRTACVIPDFRGALANQPDLTARYGNGNQVVRVAVLRSEK